MSNTVEQIINHVLDGVDKPSSYVKDPCGIHNTTVKTAIQCDSCEFTLVVMELHKTTTKTLNLIVSYGTVWYVI